MASKSPLSETIVLDLSELFKLLGDKTRLRIVLALSDGTRNVGQLCAELKLAQPTVSHHLSLLRMGKVITNTRQGKEVHYALNAAYLDRVVEDAFEEWPRPNKSEWKAGRFTVKKSARAPKAAKSPADKD